MFNILINWISPILVWPMWCMQPLELPATAELRHSSCVFLGHPPGALASCQSSNACYLSWLEILNRLYINLNGYLSLYVADLSRVHSIFHPMSAGIGSSPPPPPPQPSNDKCYRWCMVFDKKLASYLFCNVLFWKSDLFFIQFINWILPMCLL